ncbi:GGDEF domain-containing protein [Massilia sp. Dwa41.01b]|uniref:GGDEF domain-containing protein n=1 Tax=unclassified Massilia TaxID=2609279 RepID=UPI0015FF8CEA|nr:MULTISPECIES: GGDEF domain-containing protein [unclassified Massilia]QNA87653.1 GGDEF domain-containing protein [Massilia sp. Dwa41.01b]QNA98557.1 GGDEF domain-containing protein [Massilia sp. Se16.2.3]
MMSDAPLYRNHVMLLSQNFFIKDNRAQLLLHAHKYDFDILFFSELRDFVAAVEGDHGNSLYVIDLDALHNMQADMQDSRKTLMLGELLQRLPNEKSYVYLQSARQGGRFLLQQRLVDSNCLAYAEKPIANDVLVDKLFNLFVQRKRGDLIRVVGLNVPAHLDAAALLEQRLELKHHPDPQTLHLCVKEQQPDLVLITDADYERTEALVRVLKKNMEADPVREIILLQRQLDPGLTRRALASGFDAIVMLGDADLVAAQLVNRANKIRVNKDLIGKDRATGLLNKVGLQRKAQELIRQAGQEGQPLAFGVVDIDKFKTINDTWGHHFGDIVIKRLALTLAAQLEDGDLLSRFGGEEFVVVFWGRTLDEGWRRLDAMRQSFGAIAFEVKPGEVRHFSFSGGLAAYPEYKSENELFLRADAMLYEAKQGGRNRICTVPGGHAARTA